MALETLAPETRNLIAGQLVASSSGERERERKSRSGS
jgi:hypothetical protein